MRGPRDSKEIRTYKDHYEEQLYQGVVDEVEQKRKWQEEMAERRKPRAEPTLDEFLKAFSLLPCASARGTRGQPYSHSCEPHPFNPTLCREQVVSYSSNDTTACELSPVLDGHEQSRKRRAKLLQELEEAVPDAPAMLALPPAIVD